MAWQTIKSEKPTRGGSPGRKPRHIWEYISQTTSNVDFLQEDNRYKFIDDLSILEVVNLVTVGIASYNFINHVASDIGINQSFVDPRNLESQKSIDKISSWTTENKMRLNEKKTNIKCNDLQFYA